MSCPRAAEAQRFFLLGEGGSVSSQAGNETARTQTTYGGALNLILFAEEGGAMTIGGEVRAGPWSGVQWRAMWEMAIPFATALSLGVGFHELPPDSALGGSSSGEVPVIRDAFFIGGVRLRFGPEKRAFLQGRYFTGLGSTTELEYSSDGVTQRLKPNRIDEIRISAGYSFNSFTVRFQGSQETIGWKHEAINSSGQLDQKRQYLTLGVGFPFGT